MKIIRFNINVGGGLVNHIVIKENKVYRFVEDGLMIYKYNGEDIDVLIDLILEQEYDDNFIVTSEYSINTFKGIDENNINDFIDKYDL
ncbi:hypothetical protein [Terrisporobacter vanillatitrophus]|uniref:hypothetical protein n=1 Tax=Terrisporobacter vanillatitrophus TaxID=3058402 RepID=UPI003368FCF1